MKPGSRRTVEVEDLLRLKRREVPAEQFWTEFDRQLRAKQLAALVSPRPWWQGLSLARVWSGFRRYHLPLGAAAVTALTVFAIRFDRTSPPAGGTDFGATPAPQVIAKTALPPVQPIVGGTASQEPANAESTAVAETEAPPSGPAYVDGAASRFIPLLGVPVEDNPESALSSNSLYPENAFGRATIGDPVVGRSLLSATDQFNRVEARAVTARTAVEPLQQITPPGERRGTRILTAMVSMSSVENAMRATERAASRLSEEQLYDQIRRFGARGAGLNVKF